MTPREQYPWLQSSRTLLIDAYWPPLNPDLAEFDANLLVKTLKRLNADTIRFGTIGKYALIQNNFVPFHPNLNGRDLLNETIVAATGENVKIIAYIPVSHGLPKSLLSEQRPAWGLRMDDDQLQNGVRHFGGELVAPVCPFGQYRKDILSFVRHVVDNYDIHGLYLDGPYYNWNMGTMPAVCQCNVCKQTFRDFTGRDLPTNAKFFNSPDSGLHDIFHDWVGRRLHDLLRGIITIAKRNKQLPVIFNAIAAANRPEKWERKMIGLIDGFLLESDLEGLRGLGVGNYHGKIVWRYTQPHSPWPRLSSPSAERRNRHSGIETLLWGGTPIVSYAGRLCLDGAYPEPVAGLFEFMKKNNHLFTSLKAAKFAGIIAEPRLMKLTGDSRQSLAGAYKLFQRLGMPTEILITQALRDPGILREYPLLFLPGKLEIGQEEIVGIRQYIEQGGTLIASGSALSSEDEFQLADLFGVRFAPIGAIAALLERLRFRNELWDIYLRRRDSKVLLPVIDPFWIEIAVGSECLAEIVSGDESIWLPAIVRNRLGGGNCVYINFPIERLADELEEPELTKIIADLITDQPPYRIESPELLYSSLKEKDRVKLLFLCSPSGEQRTFTVNLKLRHNAMPKSVTSLISGRKLEHGFKDNQVIIDKHSFKEFECIAITS